LYYLLDIRLFLRPDHVLPIKRTTRQKCLPRQTECGSVIVQYLPQALYVKGTFSHEV
jgi:hypothetical protein